MPAIVIRNEGQRGITNLSLTREFGLLEVGHADHVHSPASINFRLSFCGKRRTFHADIRPATVHLNVRNFARLFQYIAQIITNGMSKAYVRHNAFTKKSRLARTGPGPVEKLVR